MTKGIKANFYEKRPTNKAAAISHQRFSLAILPIITPRVDTQVLVRLVAAVNQLVIKHDFECDLSRVVLFPLIAEPEIFSAPEYVRYKRKDNAVCVSRHISIDAWKRARIPGKTRLALENFISSFEALDSKRFSTENKSQICELIRQASKTLS